MAQDSRGNVKEQELQNKLNEETGKGKTEVSDIGEELEIIFTETNRYYNVSKNGTIDGPYKIVRDEYPADITENENGDELHGSEDNPYEIWCIEDLIEWSQNYSKIGRAHV